METYGVVNTSCLVSVISKMAKKAKATKLTVSQLFFAVGPPTIKGKGESSCFNVRRSQEKAKSKSIRMSLF